MGVAHIFSFSAPYLERAARAHGGFDVRYTEGCPDVGTLHREDILVCVDQAPDMPFALEGVPCISAAYLIDVHQDLHSRLQVANLFDAVFIAQKDYVAAFREIGHPHAYWLPLACDPEVHHVPSGARIFDVGFVGKLGYRGTKRCEILTRVLPRYKTNDYRLFYQAYDMGRIYGQSKIIINASINGDLNMRFFEALAAGALLVTDRIENGLSDLFEEDIHYVGYSSVEEAIRKIDFYLANDAERAKIAAAGQKLVLERHTYRNRWAQIVELSDRAFGQAPARTFSHRELAELYSEVFVSLRMPWRIPAVIGYYGLNCAVARNLFKSTGRWINARIPLTANAIRARLASR